MKLAFPKKIVLGAVMASALALTGCLTDDDKDDEEPVVELVTTRTLTAGAQSNTTFGSAIDLDLFQSYKIDSAKSRASSIDLIFAYSTASSAAAIYSPDSAKGGIGGTAGFDFLSDFTPANGTQIKTVTVANIAAIVNKGQVDSLWSIGTTAATGRLVITAGTVFLAKSNLNLTVLVKVDSVSQSATGRASLSGIAKF